MTRAVIPSRKRGPRLFVCARCDRVVLLNREFLENVRALLVEETVARPEDVCVQVTLSLAERHLARLRCLAAGEDVTLDQAATAAVLKMLVRTERTHTRSVRRSRRP